VTGASSGLGAEFALQIAQRGCNVILVARREDRLRKLQAFIEQEAGKKATILVVDLASQQGIHSVLEYTTRAGAPQFLVNNAGRGHHGAAVDTEGEVNRQMLRLNVEALTTLSLEIGRQMSNRGSGAILNIASAVAYQPAPYFAVYAATKAYVLSFSEALGAELSGSGVRVFTACPGATESEFAKVAGMGELALPFASKPQDCVRRCLNAFESGSLTYVDGALNTAGVVLSRFVPRPFVARAIALAARK
jgi:short-subunit dehydrogenase